MIDALISPNPAIPALKVPVKRSTEQDLVTHNLKLVEENRQLRVQLQEERFKNRAWVNQARRMAREMEGLLAGT